MHRHTPLVLLIVYLCCFSSPAHAASTRRSTKSASSTLCKPLKTTFSAEDIATPGLFSNPPFSPVSPPGSWAVGKDGLELYMDKPKGQIKTKGGVNNIAAEGATVNSTFLLQYGRVTMQLSAPKVAGAVTAAILIAGDKTHDEIDVELLGGDPSQWQTNIFTMSPSDKEPLYGIFGGIESYSKKSSISDLHNYTIDWNSERIIWSVDGSEVRTLEKSKTRVNGTYHYPSHPLRVQLGIWDASNPIGTAEWAHGPINWKSAPSRMTAVFRSVVVECPY